MEIFIMIVVFFIGFILGAVRERVTSKKKYSEIEMVSKLWDLANFCSTKELRDKFVRNFPAWEMQVKYFIQKLQNNAD